MVRTPKHPCGICHKNVNKYGILCNQCNFWHHIKCNNISVTEYEALSTEPDDVPWFCINCAATHRESIFPFGSIENETLLNLFDFDKPSVVDSYRHLKLPLVSPTCLTCKTMILMNISHLILTLTIILFRIYLLLTFLPLIFLFYI